MEKICLEEPKSVWVASDACQALDTFSAASELELLRIVVYMAFYLTIGYFVWCTAQGFHEFSMPLSYEAGITYFVGGFLVFQDFLWMRMFLKLDGPHRFFRELWVLNVPWLSQVTFYLTALGAILFRVLRHTSKKRKTIVSLTVRAMWTQILLYTALLLLVVAFPTVKILAALLQLSYAFKSLTTVFTCYAIVQTKPVKSPSVFVGGNFP